MQFSRRIFPAAIVFAVFILPGCIEAGLPETDRRAVEGDDGFRLEWSPPDGGKETVHMVNVTTGQDTSCKVSHWSRHRFGSETAVGSILFGHDSDGDKRVIAGLRGGETVHVGPVNTDTVGAETWGGLLFEGTGRAGARPGNGTSYEGIHGVFDSRPGESDPPMLSVECDSNEVWVRLFLADAYQPVIDKSARGGVGAHIASVNGLNPTLTMNYQDKFAIDTEGHEVRLFTTFSQRGEKQLEESVDGSLQVNSPDGSETVSLNQIQREFAFYRSWSDPGNYDLKLDQFSVESGHFMGLLAGFKLEEEWGSL